MSIQAMAWVLEHETSTSGADRLVLLSLANHADEEWECYPSVARIAREAGIARARTVQESLARLEAAGLITRRYNAAPDERIPGNRRPTLYKLRRTTTDSDRTHNGDNPGDNLELGVTDTDIPNPPGVTDTANRGDAFRQLGVTDTDTQTVKRTANKSSPLREAASDALLEVCGMGGGAPVTRTGRAILDRAAVELLDAGADPDEIRARAAVYRTKWPEAVLTPRALVRHWAHLRLVPLRVVARPDLCVECGGPRPDGTGCRLDPPSTSCPEAAAVADP